MFSPSGELGEAPWRCQGALEDLLGLSSAALRHLWEVFHVIFGSLGDLKAFPGCLLEAIGCLRGEHYPNLEARQGQKPTQAGDCVLRQSIAKRWYSWVLAVVFGFGG